jgi:hypothetical protein
MRSNGRGLNSEPRKLTSGGLCEISRNGASILSALHPDVFAAAPFRGIG